jgi:hypothetical protein
MALAIGTSFRVASIIEIKDARGRIIARFLPEHDYRVTVRNLAEVERLVASGDAILGGPAPAKAATLTAKPAKLRGRANTGQSK